MHRIYPNFKPWAGSQRPSWGGPAAGRTLPDVVGTPLKRMPTSGVHIPAGGGMFALVGVGAANGSPACAVAP